MIHRLLILVLALAAIPIFVRNSRAYDSYAIHPRINEEASRQSTNLEVVLHKLGYDNAVDGTVNGKAIYKWFRDGGTDEDLPVYRANNHFHDPLKAWHSAGLSGSYGGLSSLLWAQDQSFLGSIAGGDWSWKKARSLYYEALSSTQRPAREQRLADCFRSLGQTMHLIADVSVPAHTRNDIHVFPLDLFGLKLGRRQTYESWAAAHSRNLNYSAKSIDQSLFSRAVTNSEAPLPISALWDQDVYNGSNPEITWTTDPVLSGYGLAEYSNANYFSEDTIFGNYSHPRKEDTTAKLIEQRAKDGKLDRTWYVMGYQAERLAAYSYFQDKGSLLPETKWLYHLDSFVYRSYADNLIPRAVGYSAGLLNYFFRGSIEITLPDSAIYSLADTDIGFTKITILARNATTTGEEMSDGSVELVASYRIAQESPFQSRDMAVTNEYSYKVVPEANDTRTIPKEAPVELTFDLGQNRIVPLNAVDVRLQVVYRGRLGNEDGAVAVGFKQISDPTPVDLVNNMDRVCINGMWYVAGSAEAIAQVDANHNGIPEWDVYPHDITDVYIKISPRNAPTDAAPTDYTSHGPLLSPGVLYRSYILSDSEVNHSEYATAVRTNPADAWGHAEGGLMRGTWPGTTIKGIIEQLTAGSACAQYGTTAPCTIRRSVPFYRFRGMDLWGSLGVIFDNPEYPVGSKCSWETVR